MCFVPTCEVKGELLIQVQLLKYEVFQCIKASVYSLKVALIINKTVCSYAQKKLKATLANQLKMTVYLFS